MNNVIEVLQLDGKVYDKKFVEHLVEDMNTLRNSALQTGHMNFAVSISHVIAICNHYKNSIPT